MCTQLPNWGSEYNLKIGDEGFLTTQYFKGGEQYYDRNSNQYKTIKFTNIYFKEFIKDDKKEEIIL